MGLGRLNYRSAFTAGRFYGVLLPAAPNLQPGGEPSDLERSNFRHKVPPASEATRASPSSGRLNYGREMAERILPESDDFHATFRVLVHAVKLRHGTNGFTSLPKEGALRIFSPANLGTKGQHATSRPPKPL